MTKIVVQPNASGTGTFTIAAPNSNNTRTLTLPDETGTLLTSTGDGSALTGVGKVLNVWNVGKTNTFSTTSTSFVDLTDFSVTLTPQSASSKFLVSYSVSVGMGNDDTHAYLLLVRDSTPILRGDAAGSRTRATTAVNQGPTTGSHVTSASEFLDSPATATSITYKLQISTGSGATIYVNRSSRDNDAAGFDGRTTSTFTVMEIAG